MEYDVIVIGAGISGLSAAALLAKRGLRILVLEQSNEPGGACGVFKRAGIIFDKGVAMMYGFGEKGFNAHRFLFNCLEEPFAVVKHDLLYVVHYHGHQICFKTDVEEFIDELSKVFPYQSAQIAHFYHDMEKMYKNVICECPSYTTPDESNPIEVLTAVLKHPSSYLKFLSYMNISTEALLKKYFSDSEIINFFNKLTSTYCYGTVRETPAILAAVMFIDNHVGGSYYPAGSSMFLPGKIEKVIEKYNGELLYNHKAEKILFKNDTPRGVLLENGQQIFAKEIIYSGTVWNLYEKLIPLEFVKREELGWERAQLPTYPSTILYALVDSAVIPNDMNPVEMLSSASTKIDESEITVYIPSIDDRTLCANDQHVLIAIGPNTANWKEKNSEEYEMQKEDVIQRILDRLKSRLPELETGILYCELATPKTIEKYTMKNGGSVAGPKQMLGQHMLHRQTIRTRWDTLFCCGESTVMGTGTPTVTTSGIAAANAVLKKHGKDPYVWQPGKKEYVHVLKPPVENDWKKSFFTSKETELINMAEKCLYCENPSCCKKRNLDMPGIFRRISCGNFFGGKKVIKRAIQEGSVPVTERFLKHCESKCIQNTNGAETPNGVAIRQIFKRLQEYV